MRRQRPRGTATPEAPVSPADHKRTPWWLKPSSLKPPQRRIRPLERVLLRDLNSKFSLERLQKLGGFTDDDARLNCGLTQEPAQDAGGLRRPNPPVGRAAIATGDHHPGLSVRLVQRPLDYPGAATRRPISPQRRNRRLVRHHRCGRRALCAYRWAVILLDFGEQGTLVSNQHVIYALRRKRVTG